MKLLLCLIPISIFALLFGFFTGCHWNDDKNTVFKELNRKDEDEL